MSINGAALVVRHLEAQGVRHVFGVPGAKIDRVYDALLDSRIQTIVCRHEQNASFIAQGIGRLTGKAGVCLVTSGPGTTNLVTGFATATSEGSPVVGLGGVVPRAARLKQTHQSLDTATLFRPVAKFSAEVDSEAAIGEVLANAFRAAESPRPGAAFVALPSDVMEALAPEEVLTPVEPVRLGPGPSEAIAETARLLGKAKRPVLLLGMLAGEPRAALAIRALLETTPLPVVTTFQASGILTHELLPLYGGRVGLFHNQPADRLLDSADLVVTIGYDPIEYDQELWNKGRDRNIVHIDAVPCDIAATYKPVIEIVGDIVETVRALAARLPRSGFANPAIESVIEEMTMIRRQGASATGMPIHPLRLVGDLQAVIANDVTLCLDMGSFHIWIARYLQVFRPRQLLISNGQQTLGVALPWAIAACLVRPTETVISVSGDGGFHFSSVELETAVRLKCNLVHIIWRDGFYDMVRFQEELKYGRSSGVEFGPIDTIRFAESMGARGFAVERAEDFAPTLRKAIDLPGPVLIDVPVDYSHNKALAQQVLPQALI
ncbi:MAG TPA: acetolactate synthase AlsS [Pirellulales bacterium]|jgi:acetolactate synthase-1/2/3 large subunit|nr:acetolactate synthase AlsS [Pirellulales bacterium]